MALAQWLFGFADQWNTLGGIPVACPEAGTVTDVVMFTTQPGPLTVALGTENGPYFNPPNAHFVLSDSDGWVTKSLYDPTIDSPWGGPDPLVVAAGQPLWIELDAASIEAGMLYFGVLISVPSGLPTPVASNIGAGQRTSGARIASQRVPRGFTG